MRGRPTSSGGTNKGRSTEDSRWTTAAGNGGSSADTVELRDRYMLISEPTPSARGEAGAELRVTSRNGAPVEGAIDNVGDPGVGFRSRETRERLPRGDGVKPVLTMLTLESRREGEFRDKRLGCKEACSGF